MEQSWRFTPDEVKELVISWIALAIIFSIAWGFSRFPTILVTLGLAFIGHELAHKFVAQNYGFWAQYKMHMNGLLFAFFLALITSFGGFPIVFAAPGAVMISPVSAYGRTVSRGQMGRIGLAGPLANLFFAAFFAVVYLIVISVTVKEIALVGLWVNSFLALFNLLPFGVLDGAKVFRWNNMVWGATALLAFFALNLA